MFTEYLGIKTGDIVRPGYTSLIYEVVTVTPPYMYEKYVSNLVIFPEPVVSLVLRNALEPGDRNFGYINEVRRTPEGRYFSRLDELVIEREDASGFHQMGLFAVEETYQGYPFQEGVNYDCLDGELWKCDKCGKDFNALYQPVVPDMIPGDPRGRHPLCPVCCHWASQIFVARAGEKWSGCQLNLHIRMVEQYKQHCPERIAYLLNPPPPTKKARKKNA